MSTKEDSSKQSSILTLKEKYKRRQELKKANLASSSKRYGISTIGIKTGAEKSSEISKTKADTVKNTPKSSSEPQVKKKKLSQPTKLQNSNGSKDKNNSEKRRESSSRKISSGHRLKDEKKRSFQDHKSKLKNEDDELQELLSIRTTKEEEETKVSDAIQELLTAKSYQEKKVYNHFRSTGGSQVHEFCSHGTRDACVRVQSYSSCKKLHFRKIIKPHTDENMGDCSFLNTCFHMDTCKYVHYEVDYRGSSVQQRSNKRDQKSHGKSSCKSSSSVKSIVSDEEYLSRKMLPPQWIDCDIRYLDFSVLGKFSVIMADPPWDIHMELPYGTMQDQEMRNLKVQDLSDDGLIFLWVTGRAMELGRELLKVWGYKRCDELIWVKTNQLQRLIRTGRTGHWLNHGKEHCLIGIKGNPQNVNKKLDCDVLVAEVRATSHKPDEIYGIIERLSPGTRKLELFGRSHNIQPNWVTIGNQLDGVHLVEKDLTRKFTAKYPGGKVEKPQPVKETVSPQVAIPQQKYFNPNHQFNPVVSSNLNPQVVVSRPHFNSVVSSRNPVASGNHTVDLNYNRLNIYN